MTVTTPAGATASNAVIKAWKDKGGKVLVAIRTSRASTRR